MNNTKQNVPYDLIEQELFERKKYEKKFGKNPSGEYSLNYTIKTSKFETQNLNSNDSYELNSSLNELTDYRNYELEKMKNLNNK